MPLHQTLPDCRL